MLVPENSALILWYHYGRRAVVLSEHLNAKTLFVNHLIKSRGIIWKLFFWADYAYKGLYTLLFLVYYKPDVVFATSPPAFCPIFCWAYCKVFRKKLIVDAHNSAFTGRWISTPFYKNVLQSAFMVIVHNYEYEKYLKKKYPNIRFHTLHDKIPTFKPVNGKNGKDTDNRKHFLLPISYGYDEPVEQLFEAIESFLNRENTLNIGFKITGNYLKRKDLYERYNRVDGIEFLGFVDFNIYDNLLRNAFGVIALTTAQMVQQCAVIEAMGASVPVIVTETETNLRLFYRGAVFTKVDVSGIENAIREFVYKRPELAEGVEAVRNHWHKRWETDFEKLNRRVGQMPAETVAG